MKVAILGCGPTGLIAAYAVVHAGHEPVVFSKKRKSDLFGAQYLHEQIPDIYVDQVDVNYTLVGSIEGYREKVYGDREVDVSPESLMRPHKAWDIRETYDVLWSMFRNGISDTSINPEWLHDLRGFDQVISTIPRTMVCRQDHTFDYETIWASGDAPSRGKFIQVDCPDNTVECNGDPDTSHYRISNIFGHKTAEWPASSLPAQGSGARVIKPIGTDCTCFSNRNVLFVGRYGKWSKGELSHMAFSDTLEALQ